MNSHRGICNRLLWMQEQYGLGGGDRVLQKTPVSFDVSVWELFWPLLSGACLVMARPEGHKDPGYLAEVIAGEGVTTVHFVPSMLRAFLEVEVGGCLSLRRVICSGEALGVDLQERFYGRLGWAQLWNLYGPTEAAVDVSVWECEREGGRGVVPIGRPIANLRLLVLDRELHPGGLGVPGELYLGGVGVGRGYWRRPELTAERFVPDPCAVGERLYRTGDAARLLRDGATEFLGRLDFQVKVRGFRIELGEIEATLERHPDVAAAVVTAGGDRPVDVQLTAWVVCHPGCAVKSRELRDFLAQSLPGYMVPARFVLRDRLPLTANGKIDRTALQG